MVAVDALLLLWGRLKNKTPPPTHYNCLLYKTKGTVPAKMNKRKDREHALECYMFRWQDINEHLTERNVGLANEKVATVRRSGEERFKNMESSDWGSNTSRTSKLQKAEPQWWRCHWPRNGEQHSAGSITDRSIITDIGRIHPTDPGYYYLHYYLRPKSNFLIQYRGLLNMGTRIKIFL